MFTGAGALIPRSPEMHIWACILGILCMLSLYTIGTVRGEVYFKLFRLQF